MAAMNGKGIYLHGIFTRIRAHPERNPRPAVVGGSSPMPGAAHIPERGFGEVLIVAERIPEWGGQLHQLVELRDARVRHTRGPGERPLGHWPIAAVNQIVNPRPCRSMGMCKSCSASCLQAMKKAPEWL